MKRLLLSLCLVGAVFPGHTRLVLQTAQGPPTSVEQPIEARAVSTLSGTATLESMPQPPDPGVERMAVQSLAIGQDTQAITSSEGDKQHAPLPTPSESFAPSASPVPEVKNQEANWVVVIRGATVHSGPSVSAPIVRLYSIGTELRLIDYQHGWFQVLDPVTSQRGWIYEKYYLEAIRGSGQMVASLQEPAKPQQEVVNARKPTPHVRRAKNLGPRPTKRIQPSIASAPRYRYETVASILDRALRP
jgi:hypothetical protein